LINNVVLQASVLTAEISQALNSGRHTTSTTTLYWVSRAEHSALIDSPGFQEFGLHHVQATQLAQYMPDVAAHAMGCRFYNCTHMHEPGCAVIAAVDNPRVQNPVSVNRYRIYADLFAECSQARHY
jgi:ribosome biogenesis GTPase